MSTYLLIEVATPDVSGQYEHDFISLATASNADIEAAIKAVVTSVHGEEAIAGDDTTYNITDGVLSTLLEEDICIGVAFLTIVHGVGAYDDIIEDARDQSGSVF